MIKNKFSKQKLWASIRLFLLSLMVIFSVVFLYKKGHRMATAHLSHLLKKEIQKQNLHIQWETMNLSVFPLKIHWKNVLVDIPSPTLPAPLSARSLILKPDYIALLKRRKLIFKVFAESLSAQIKLSPSSVFSHTGRSQKISFAFPNNLPLSQVHLQDSTLLVISPPKHTFIKPKKLFLSLHPSKITLSGAMSFIGQDDRPGFSSKLNIMLTPYRVSLSLFELKSAHSHFKADGRIKGSLSPFKINSGQMRSKGSFVMEDLSTLFQIVYPAFKNPFKGTIDLTTQIHYHSSEQWKGSIDLKATELFFNKIRLSQAWLKAKLKKQNLLIERLQIGKERWAIALKNSQVRLKKPFSFHTQALVKKAPLSTVFSDLSLKHIPLYGNLKGAWTCEGKSPFLLPPKHLLAKEWIKKLTLNCEGASHLRNFKVQHNKEDLILKVPHLQIQNQVITLSDLKAEVKAQIAGPDSQLLMESTFTPATGFLSHFKGQFNLSDLEDLVQLQPKGIAHIENGILEFSKSRQSVKADLKTEDLVLDGFYIGSAKSQLDWKQDPGILNFRKIKGRFKSSHYRGYVRVNIPKNFIHVFAHPSFIALQDLKFALKNHIYFPFSIKGKGRLNGYLYGPFKANMLSYSLEGQLFDIVWQGESFDRGFLNVESKEGHVKTKQAFLTKGPGQVHFKGYVDPKGNLNARLTGKKLSLQSSENISQALNHDLEGDMDFDMTLSGYFLKPLNHTKITIQNSFFKSYPLEDSSLNLNIHRDFISVDGSLAGKINLKKFIFPYESTGQVSIKADVRGLDIKELFFSRSDSSALYNQFQSQVDGSFDLIYKRGQMTRSLTGFIKADNFSLSSAGHQLKNHNVLSLTFQKGLMEITPFALQSSNQFLSLTQDQKIHITGGLKIDFLIFLFPFMKTWEGDLQTNFYIEPKLFSPNLTGDITLTNGFIQLNDHIDPFESATLSAYIEKKTIKIPSFYTKFGGGDVRGQGQLFWSPQKTLAVDVTAGFKNVIFSSLPGLFVRGQGDLYLKGKDFPYTLGMSAKLEDLKIEKEFNTSSSADVQLSHRLLALKESTKERGPLNLNLKLFPQNSLQIENSVMRANFSGNLKVKGPPENPLLTGNLKALPGGFIRFRDHDFTLRSAQVRYKGTPPSNPLLDLRADSSIREEPGAGSGSSSTEVESFSNEYQVRLRIKGQGRSPRFNLSATPPLPEKEIVSLLAFGARSIKFEPGNPLNNITRYSYSHFGPALFQKAIGRELKNTLGVVDQFLIIPHISSKTNSPTTKLIVRKTIFNRLDLSSSHTLLDEERESDIKAKYKINNNVSLIGLWQNESLKESQDEESNALGLNMEYQIDF